MWLNKRGVNRETHMNLPTCCKEVYVDGEEIKN